MRKLKNEEIRSVKKSKNDGKMKNVQVQELKMRKFVLKKSKKI